MVGLNEEKFAPLSDGGIISVVGGQIRAASPYVLMSGIDG